MQTDRQLPTLSMASSPRCLVSIDQLRLLNVSQITLFATNRLSIMMAWHAWAFHLLQPIIPREIRTIHYIMNSKKKFEKIVLHRLQEVQ